MNILKPIIISTLFLSAFAANTTYAQQYIFPEKGQSKEQQQQDEYSCHTWAVGETGYDPTKPQTQATPPPAAAPVQQGATRGSGGRGAISGAAAGAIIAGIGDNDVSNGAAKGAAIGAIAARRQSRRANEQAAQQQEAQQQQAAQQVQQASSEQIANYTKARSVCLEAKGYSVSQ